MVIIPATGANASIEEGGATDKLLSDDVFLPEEIPVDDEVYGGAWEMESESAMPYVEADSWEDAEPMLDAIADKVDDGMTASTAARSVGATTLASSNGPCTLYPSVVYMRTSSAKTAAGFKPYTKCSVLVQRIYHTSELRFQYYLTWKLAQKKTGKNMNSKSYTQKNIELFCKDLKQSTLFKGTTTGQIVYGGKSYYSKVYTPVARHKCRA